MGLTLIAILTTALLLPGIVAARVFYQASKTKEVEPAIPSLSSTDGIALVGLFSVAVHVVFVIALMAVTALPPVTALPAADPYILFTPAAAHVSSLHAASALVGGLAWLCIIAAGLGFAGGKIMMRTGDASIFYGALSEVITRGHGADRFVAAYVLTKMRHDGRMVGYQGTVVSLLRDADRFPAKIVLRDASLFYLDIAGERPERREHGRLIDWIALTAEGWENVAFKVFAIENERAAEPN